MGLLTWQPCKESYLDKDRWHVGGQTSIPVQACSATITQECKDAGTESVHPATEKLQPAQFQGKDVDKTYLYLKTKQKRGFSEKQKQSGHVSHRYSCCEKQLQKSSTANLESTLTIWNTRELH